MNNNQNNSHPADASHVGSTPRLTPEQLRQNLQQFTGTENYYRHWYGLVYTDGIKYLIEHARCHWLLDAIASYQLDLSEHPDQRLHEMQFWKLTVQDNRGALLECVPDAGEPAAVSQLIEWTDFPLPEIQIWLQIVGSAAVAILPSEY
ncbi:MAG TPA: hypothetical protein VM008_07705 [Phycisphaerae bacterium]|nr:hypothetical protein [Phycisphaerae bacterium]